VHGDAVDGGHGSPDRARSIERVERPPPRLQGVPWTPLRPAKPPLVDVHAQALPLTGDFGNFGEFGELGEFWGVGLRKVDKC
jgi:hypothetical protein